MKPTRNRSFMSRPAESYDGIILAVKKKGQYHVVTVFTKQQGILHVLVRSSKKGKQGFGVLMPLSTLTFDALRQGEVYTLSEYDGKSNPAMQRLTLDGYAYSQLFIEIILHLVPPDEPDYGVYQLLLLYGQAIVQKPIRLVTIIAGWQLVAVAGFGPDVDTVRVFQAYQDGEPIYYLGDEGTDTMTELTLTNSLKGDWQAMLTYPWGSAQTVHFKQTNIDILETLLYQYVEQCSERKLNSLTLWKQLHHM